MTASALSRHFRFGVFPLDHERELHVFLHREDRDKIVRLENERDVVAAVIGQLLFGQAAELAAVVEHAAAGRRVEAADDVEQRALAAARRAHDGKEFSFFNGNPRRLKAITLLSPFRYSFLTLLMSSKAMHASG